MLRLGGGGESTAAQPDNDLVMSSMRFQQRPQLVHLRNSTNLLQAFSSSSAASAEHYSQQHQQQQHVMLQMVHAIDYDSPTSAASSSIPDFASDNDVLGKLLAWRFSDQAVSVLVHKIGKTLVLLQHGSSSSSPTFSSSSSASSSSSSSPSPSRARLVSGFDLLHPKLVADGDKRHCPVSLEEETRLLRRAALQHEQQLANSRSTRRGGGAVPPRPPVEHLLDAALHSLSAGDDDIDDENAPNVSSASVHVYPLHAWDYHILLKSCLRVYRDKSSTSTSLILRDARKELPAEHVARVFIDNLLAGVARVNVCLHRDGLVTGYETYETWEIPTRLSANHKIDVGEIERNAHALLHFLQYECADDLSIHWLFKGQGERVARLWRLDPARDDALDVRFRDQVMFQHAMLCLGSCSSSSSQCIDRAREVELVRRSVELLDRCSELRDGGGMLRRPLRAALRERLADLTFFFGDGENRTEAGFAELKLAMELLLGEEEEEEGGTYGDDDDEGEARRHRPGHVQQAKLRVLERGLSWAMMSNSPSSGGGSDNEALLAEACDWAEEASSSSSSTSPPLLWRARKLQGERMMERARMQAQHGLLEETKVLLQRAIDYFERATRLLPRTAAAPHAACFFQLGNALNEYGKLLLTEGRLGDARLVFSRGVNAFRAAGDANNLCAVRCNVAHTFRLGRTRGTLELALGELHLGLKDAPSQAWVQCFRKEIFKTMMVLAAQLAESGREEDERREVLHRALHEFAASPEESATAHFHLAHIAATTTTTTTSAVERRIAHRHLEQVVALLPDGHVLNAHARVELAESALELRTAPAAHVLKQVLDHVREEEDGSNSGLRSRVVSVLCCALRKLCGGGGGQYKRAYRLVLDEMLHPHSSSTTNALIARVRDALCNNNNN